MPLVTAIPKGLQNGNVLTEFTDTTNTSSVTYTYPTQQTSLIIENSGEKDIFVTVGSYTDQLIQADKKWKADTLFTSFSIKSNVNSQEFIATSTLKVIEDFTEVNSQITSITSQLASKETEINNNKNLILNILPLYKNKVHPNLQHLFNPFVKSQIKLLGDSITAGAGGTGYSATGETIFSSYKANVPTATCWANSFAKFINDNFNKTIDVSIDNAGITTIGTNSVLDGTGIFGKSIQLTNYTADTNGLQFTFYGTEFTVIHAQQPSNGIVNVYVDDVLNTQLDGYSASWVDREVKISGLTEGTHTVKIMDTNTKNASATNKLFIIEGLRIPKKTVCKNWGISGVNSKFIYDNLSSLSPADDTTVILQIGTNDRGAFKSPQYTIYNYKRILAALTAANKNLIIMVANSTTDEPGTMNFKMVDLDNAIQKYCIDNNIEYVSNYKAFINYCARYNINLSTMLDGIGLHPNDTGHSLMNSNVIHGLGL